MQSLIAGLSARSTHVMFLQQTTPRARKRPQLQQHSLHLQGTAASACISSSEAHLSL